MSSRVNQKQSCRDEGLGTVNPLAKSMSRLRLRCTDVPLAWTFVATALAGAILTAAAGRSAAADSTVVKRFSNGTTHNSVGIVDASEDAPQDGPQAIYAADDGSLYLLDQVNGRVVAFDPKKPNHLLTNAAFGHVGLRFDWVDVGPRRGLHKRSLCWGGLSGRGLPSNLRSSARRTASPREMRS